MRGYFITFEGGDGAGKTTLIEKLSSTLRAKGSDLVLTRAPGGTPAGKVIRELVLHSEDPLAPRAELLLFLADRAQQVEKVILPALAQGKTVLCDRYNESTIAYQGVARGLDLPFVKAMCSFATKGLMPDLTLYLDIDPAVGLERVKKEKGKADQIEKEDLSFHAAIRRTYHKLAMEEAPRMQIIDASRSPEEVFSHALRYIEERLFAKRK